MTGGMQLTDQERVALRARQSIAVEERIIRDLTDDYRDDVMTSEEFNTAIAEAMRRIALAEAEIACAATEPQG